MLRAYLVVGVFAALLLVLRPSYAEITLRDDFGAEGDEWSRGGGDISYDDQSMVICSWKHNAWTGKCVVLSASSPGATDWEDNQHVLIRQQGQPGDKLQYGRFSPDATSIVACGTSSYGFCTVFSESSPGARDWNDTQVDLVPANQNSADYFGSEGGAVFTSDSSAILVCAYYWNSGEGKCFAFLETVGGAKDWNATQVDLVRAVPSGGSENLGHSPPLLSNDDAHVLACSYSFNSLVGRCIVWSQVVVGSNDWTDEQSLEDTMGAAGDRLGLQGYTFSPDGKHIIVSAYGYNSFTGKVVVFSATDNGFTDWNAAQYILTDAGSDGTYQYFGWGGIVISPLGDTIVACSHAAGGQGKCVVFSESSIGSMDWNDTQHELIDDTGASGEQFSWTGPQMIASTQQIIVCSYVYKIATGKCVLFSETNTGSQDWNSNQQILALQSGQRGDFFSQHCSFIAPSGNTFTGCSHGAEAESYTGKCSVFDLQDQCLSTPCLHSVNCTDGDFVPVCACLDGFTGEFCEVDIDDCVSEPCFNGGICTDDGSVPVSYNCSCASGYSGVDCAENIDDCLSGPCQNSAICEDNTSVAHSFSCSCIPGTGFTGVTCAEDIDDCSSTPCQNDGICSDDGSLPDTFNCTCDPSTGFTGVTCAEDIDDCSSAPCQHDGICSDDGSLPDTFNCTCEPGYSGISCEIPSPCDLAPCDNDGLCVNLTASSGFECLCPIDTNITGTLCDVILLPHKPGYLVEIEVDLSLFNDSAALETLVVKNWMLDELITLEPRSVPEQYNVSVVSMNRTYTIGILIGSTEKVDAEEIVEVLERDSEDKEGWTIISISREGENTVDLTADSEPEEESNVFFILLVLGGTVGILSIGLLLLMCNKRKHKIFSGPSKRTYSVPG